MTKQWNFITAPSEQELEAFFKALEAYAKQLKDRFGVEAAVQQRRTAQQSRSTRMNDRDHAITWARNLSERRNWVILDTETTGLGPEAEIVQLGILAPDGRALLDTLVRPIDPIPAGATAIHGITNAMVAGAPYFSDVYEELSRLLAGQLVVVYNAAYDRRILQQTCRRALRLLTAWGWACAMEQYAAFVGDWSDYHGNYRWQPLPGGDHTAIGDCRATLEIIKEMAAATLSTEGDSDAG